MPEDADSAGRPSKLTEEFIAAMMDVINSEDNSLIYTDEELVFLINEQLPLEARIYPDPHLEKVRDSPEASPLPANRTVPASSLSIYEPAANSGLVGTPSRSNCSLAPGKSSNRQLIASMRCDGFVA